MRQAGVTAGRLPNLLVIGAQKAGTTWLHRRLAEHPSIFMSRRKELNLFGDRLWDQRLDEYRTHFPPAIGKLFYGESTPGYFWAQDPASPWSRHYLNGNPDIPGSVLRTLGAETRLVISLRHPVERAVSAFFHHFRRGRAGAEDRLSVFGARVGVVAMGFYARHWQAWTAQFGEDAPIVVLFDRIARDPAGVMDHVLRRLALAPVAPPRAEAEHAGFVMRVKDGALGIDPHLPANQALAARWGCEIAQAPRVTAEELALLHDLYREDIAFCQARWCDAAGVDWTRPRGLEDLLTAV